ncbi:hypothetical protein [Pantoea ananatis]|uniref:hypothetical protein n=1 Tax=Pantoea ananas TaxID=553 RepID=UPI001B30A5B0|nr:hypothetical protein [Pantoea ananatis]
MTYYAYDSVDLNKNKIYIGVWLNNYPKNTPRCLICDEDMILRSVHANGRAHFSHLPNSKCPTILPNSVPFSNLPKIPKNVALRNFSVNWTKDKLWCIYHKIRGEFYNLQFSWDDMKDCILEAKKYDIWSYANMSNDYIPYVLLSCRGVFPIAGKRTKEYNYYLEPLTNTVNAKALPWNNPGKKKNYIWEVEILSKNARRYSINLVTNEPYFYQQVNNLIV